jgi:hypothetical protein
MHEGLFLGRAGLLSASHYTADQHQHGATAATALTAGTFFHVAGVVDPSAGETRVFVNGVHAASSSWPKNLRGREYGGGAWRVGIGAPGAANYRWCARGTADDVRIYARALSKDEIRALAAGAVAPAPASAPTEPEWRSIIDPRSLLWLSLEGEGGWRMEDGALRRVPGKATAAQTVEQFGDGEFRIRFTVSGGSLLWFQVRQMEGGGSRVTYDRKTLADLRAGDHELVIRAVGNEVTGEMDGRPVSFETSGKSTRGHLQFTVKDGDLAIRSIEFRPRR